jgi:hypothetical protein
LLYLFDVGSNNNGNNNYVTKLFTKYQNYAIFITSKYNIEVYTPYTPICNRYLFNKLNKVDIGIKIIGTNYMCFGKIYFEPHKLRISIGKSKQSEESNLNKKDKIDIYFVYKHHTNNTYIYKYYLSNSTS